MKERPIIFNGNMVRAILDGHKTQTRRPIKYQPTDAGLEWRTACGGDFAAWQDPGLLLDEHSEDGGPCQRICPFGRTGDMLWVRETWSDEPNLCRLAYKADIEDGIGCLVKRWTPSIHMPRWASRITLEIVSVRVERVQDISEEDARAESAPLWFEVGPFTSYETKTHKSGFESLWDSIYAKKYPWSSNPWVWAIEFKKLEGGQ